MSDTDEIAHLTPMGDPVEATKEEIEAARLLPFIQVRKVTKT